MTRNPLTTSPLLSSVQVAKNALALRGVGNESRPDRLHRRDIDQMVHDVMQHVPAERLDAKATAVRANSTPVPLRSRYLLEAVRDPITGGDEFIGHHRGHRALVVLLDRGLVLVPVRKARVVRAEHQGKPRIEDLKHVADVAAVFEHGPPVTSSSGCDVVSTKRDLPSWKQFADTRRELISQHSAAVEATLLARALQHPRPILLVWKKHHLGDTRSRRHARCLSRTRHAVRHRERSLSPPRSLAPRRTHQSAASVSALRSLLSDSSSTPRAKIARIRLAIRSWSSAGSMNRRSSITAEKCWPAVSSARVARSSACGTGMLSRSAASRRSSASPIAA